MFIKKWVPLFGAFVVLWYCCCKIVWNYTELVGGFFLGKTTDKWGRNKSISYDCQMLSGIHDSISTNFNDFRQIWSKISFMADRTKLPVWNKITFQKNSFNHNESICSLQIQCDLKIWWNFIPRKSCLLKQYLFTCRNQNTKVSN